MQGLGHRTALRARNLDPVRVDITAPNGGIQSLLVRIGNRHAGSNPLRNAGLWR